MPSDSPPDSSALAPGLNPWAVASVILSVLWIYGIGSIFGVIFGLFAKGQIPDTGQAGAGLATAGIAIGSVGLVAVVVLIVVLALTG